MSTTSAFKFMVEKFEAWMYAPLQSTGFDT